MGNMEGRCCRRVCGASQTIIPKGKFVADGKFDPAAVSKQCGAKKSLTFASDIGAYGTSDK